MAYHPGRALLDSRNSPLANAVQSLDVARLRELIAGGADANTRIGPKSALHELCSTPDVAPLENYEPPRATIRAGASCTIGFSTNVRRPGPFLEGRLGATSLSCFPYFIKVHAAGGIKAYEKAHLKRLVAMLVHKFPQLPAAVHPNIARHWAHVGDY